MPDAPAWGGNETVDPRIDIVGQIAYRRHFGIEIGVIAPMRVEAGDDMVAQRDAPVEVAGGALSFVDFRSLQIATFVFEDDAAIFLVVGDRSLLKASQRRAGIAGEIGGAGYALIGRGGVPA